MNPIPDPPPWIAAAIGAAGDIAYELDLATDRLTLGGAVEALLGPGASAPTGEAFQTRINPEDLPDRLRALADHVAGQGDYNCEYRLRDALGRVHWVHDRGACTRDAAGRALRLIGILRPVTERRQDAARRAQHFGYDDLTGHFSRNRLAEALEFAIAHAKRHETLGGLMAVGIDGLAAIEDAAGDEAADRLVIEVGRRLDSCLRATDMIARIGGDAFGVLLTPCDSRQLAPTAQRIRAAITAPDPASQLDPPRSVAIGAVAFPGNARSAADALTRAEEALATARRTDSGFAVFQPTEAERDAEEAAIAVAGRLHRALRNGGLMFAYQPVVRADTLEPVYYECLLRLDQGDGGATNAPGIIAAVERLGDIPAIDRKTLEMAITTLERHPPVALSVNLSGLTVNNRAWLRSLNARLRHAPAVARRLTVEITETAAMRDIEESARFIGQVRELGVRVALDDFGAGFTSFRHLKALAVDVVKIDSSFVAGVAQNVDSQLFIQSLAAVAHGLGLASVAEGPASAADEAFLRAHGVEYFQGHRYGPPTIAPSWMRALNPASGDSA
ncbi:MAG: GGDEF and EAL domain-containing protein [Alphaproteobacteria bacterium]|nr:GGDEF and EAL domain-containing protein [Alphaproteobacteria bacterium]